MEDSQIFKILNAMTPQEREEFQCAMDPTYFMRNYIKVRSQQESVRDDLDDEAEIIDDNNLPSTVQLLSPWPKQEELITSLQKYHWVIAPKSRKIGFTTIGIGFGNWIQIFTPNSRTHYISRRDDAAINMVERHKFSYRRLPDWMRSKFRVVRDNDHIFALRGPDGDERVAQAYPATEDTAIEETADYTLLDEFASIKEPLAGKLWSGLEPTIAPNGYVLIISRGKGPQGTFAKLISGAMR